MNFSVEEGRIRLEKMGEDSCKVKISRAHETDQGLWKGTITTYIDEKENYHHSNISVIIKGIDINK